MKEQCNRREAPSGRPGTRGRVTVAVRKRPKWFRDGKNFTRVTSTFSEFQKPEQADSRRTRNSGIRGFRRPNQFTSRVAPGGVDALVRKIVSERSPPLCFIRAIQQVELDTWSSEG